MANETSNNTADNGNMTADNNTADEGNVTAIIDTVKDSGILDTIMDEPLLMALCGVVLGMGGYIAVSYTHLTLPTTPYV